MDWQPIIILMALFFAFILWVDARERKFSKLQIKYTEIQESLERHSKRIDGVYEMIIDLLKEKK